MPIFALQTWAGTFAYYDPRSDRLRHAPAGQISNVVSVRCHNGTLSFDFAPHDPADLLAHKLKQGEFSVFGDLSSKISIQAEGYLCAEAIGTIVANRSQISTWETFNLVPIGRVRPILGKDLDHQAVLVKSVPRSARIPPTIHQIYISRIDSVRLRTQPPEPFVANILAMQAQNPGFTHRLWTREDIYDAICDWFGFEILEYYLQINPRYAAARADFFRYLLMYKNGGVYLDLKSGLSRPLEDSLRPDDTYLLSHWHESQLAQQVLRCQELAHKPAGEYQQWFIAASPGHPYLESVINTVLRNLKDYDRKRFGIGKQGVLRTTGPVPYTLGVDRVLDHQQHRMIEAEAEGFVFRSVEAGPAYLGQHYSELFDDVVLR